jgi:hypothetical protein
VTSTFTFSSGVHAAVMSGLLNLLSLLLVAVACLSGSSTAAADSFPHVEGGIVFVSEEAHFVTSDMLVRSATVTVTGTVDHASGGEDHGRSLLARRIGGRRKKGRKGKKGKGRKGKKARKGKKGKKAKKFISSGGKRARESISGSGGSSSCSNPMIQQMVDMDNKRRGGNKLRCSSRGAAVAMAHSVAMCQCDLAPDCCFSTWRLLCMDARSYLSSAAWFRNRLPGEDTSTPPAIRVSMQWPLLV